MPIVDQIQGAQFTGPVHSPMTVVRSPPSVRPLRSTSEAGENPLPVHVAMTAVRSPPFTRPSLVMSPLRFRTSMDWHRRLVTDGCRVKRYVRAFSSGGAKLSTSVLLVTLATTADSLSVTEDGDRRRRIGGYTAVGIGAGLMIGGAVLVGLGVKKRKDATGLAEQKSRMSLYPTWDGRRLGFGFALRF